MGNITADANEINYNSCRSIQDVIAIETQEIATTHPDDHDELAQLYTSRGESYLLNGQYEKAVEDFQKANFHISHFNDIDAAKIVAFRTAFGEVVSYDNLGLHEQTQQALENLQIIAANVGCDDCLEHRPCQEKISLSPPITRKWREWKKNKERHILPNEKNLPLYKGNS